MNLSKVSKYTKPFFHQNSKNCRIISSKCFENSTNFIKINKEPFPIKFQNQKNLFNNLKNFNSEVFFHLNSCYFICSKCHLITCMFVIDVSESLSDPPSFPKY